MNFLPIATFKVAGSEGAASAIFEVSLLLAEHFLGRSIGSKAYRRSLSTRSFHANWSINGQPWDWP
jgi:hypothetical protein